MALQIVDPTGDLHPRILTFSLAMDGCGSPPPIANCESGGPAMRHLRA